MRLILLALFSVLAHAAPFPKPQASPSNAVAPRPSASTNSTSTERANSEQLTSIIALLSSLIKSVQLTQPRIGDAAGLISASSILETMSQELPATATTTLTNVDPIGSDEQPLPNEDTNNSPTTRTLTRASATNLSGSRTTSARVNGTGASREAAASATSLVEWLGFNASISTTRRSGSVTATATVKASRTTSTVSTETHESHGSAEESNSPGHSTNDEGTKSEGENAGSEEQKEETEVLTQKQIDKINNNGVNAIYAIVSLVVVVVGCVALSFEKEEGSGEESWALLSDSDYEHRKAVFEAHGGTPTYGPDGILLSVQEATWRPPVAQSDMASPAPSPPATATHPRSCVFQSIESGSVERGKKAVSFATDLTKVHIFEKHPDDEGDGEEWDGTIGALLRSEATILKLFQSETRSMLESCLDDVQPSSNSAPSQQTQPKKLRNDLFFGVSYAVSKPFDKVSADEMEGTRCV
ncbi:hypothetical protein HDU80_011030 [Chytriomyces hyalinus]|nr:hypothetical protein HDU80_011030 [Chytriomyces hyalinus]